MSNSVQQLFLGYLGQALFWVPGDKRGTEEITTLREQALLVAQLVKN